jgi:glyoxylase-like metal-dependent hydrolase (beta-lactamase superfamily II)
MANARVLVSQRGARHVEDPTKLVKSVIGIYGADAISAFGTPLAVARERIEAMASVRHLDLGGGKRLRLFSTPGHAPHQMSVLLENERLLITGDAVGLRYPSFNVVIPASMPPSFDEAQWVETLNRFRRMDLAGLLLPHFGPVLQDVGGFIQKNLEATEQWGSRIRQALTENEPLSEVIEYFLADIAERTRKPRDGLPERMTRAVSLSVTGFYQHAQRKSRGQ